MQKKFGTFIGDKESAVAGANYYHSKFKRKGIKKKHEANVDLAQANNPNNPNNPAYNPIKHEIEKIKANIANPIFSDNWKEAEIVKYLKSVNAAITRKAKLAPIVKPTQAADNNQSAKKYDKAAINPSHYKKHALECIQVREAMSSTLLSDCLKYVWRLGLKDNAKQDKEKALWYLARFEENCKRDNLISDFSFDDYFEDNFYDFKFVEQISNFEDMDNQRIDALCYILALDTAYKQGSVSSEMFSDIRINIEDAYKNTLMND